MIKKNLFLLIYILFLFACAKQSAPTGGPKDTIPPILIKSVPKNETVNFKGKTIELEFSEMVDASNAKDQLIITPTIGKDYEVRTKKNSVIVEIKKPLKDSTTYSFNFRESVKDVTEKNPSKKLQLAISTGTYLDSLAVSGTITDLLRGKEIKDATVALHEPNDTISILKHPATIITKTDDKGKFKIDYLKPGKYYLYAFEDKNKNLIVDSRTESYGFLAKAIDLKKDTANVNLSLVRLDARPLRITSSRPFNTYFNVKATKNIKDFEIKSTAPSDLYYSFGEDHSNIKIFSAVHVPDSVQFNLSAIDSIGNKIDTTLYAKFIARETTPEKFSSEIESKKILAEKGLIKITLTFNKPIKQTNFDSLFYQIDSLQTIKFTPEDLTSNYTQTKITLSKKINKTLFASKPTEEKKETKPIQKKPPSDNKKETAKEPAEKKITDHQFYSAKGTFISIDNDTSRKITEQMIPQKLEDLSMIIYEIKTNQKHVLVQLLDKNLELLAQFEDKPKGQFDDLPAGQYLLRVVIDTNNNHVWDAGNYLKNTEPEKIFYYKGGEKGELSINLKANWELVLSPMLVTY